MATTYLLDLTKEEYRDDFVSLNEDNAEQHKEFWQYEARDKLVDKLKSFVKDAIAYKSARTEKKHKTWLSHNSILINGARGTGKTVFLRNCKAMWQAHCKHSSDVAGSIYFLPAIDPTMLVDHDNFANVIIAQIYTEVDKVLNNTDYCVSSGNIGEDSKQQFYKALQKLADSLGKKEEFEGCNGIDKILQYKSGINIESRFHDYVEAALHLLGSSAIALPIDDVDMALDRAYEVVDEVRRLLGCPYIIPIVSGDYSLYEQMVNVHFDEKAHRDNTRDRELIKKGKEIAKDLTNAYLTKVFPNQMRITLLPVNYIYPTLRFKLSKIEEGKTEHYNQWLKYSEFETLVKEEFYPLCKNEEVLKGWPAPESAREFTQFARTISPDELKKAKIDEIASYNLWKNYINWAEQKQEGLAYSNVNSYLTLVNQDEEASFNILDLPSFNPTKQVQITRDYIKWARKKFTESQFKSLNLPRVVKSSDIHKTPNNQWLIDNIALLEESFTYKDKSVSSMPPIEFFNKKSSVTKSEVDISIREDLTRIVTTNKSNNDSKNSDESAISCNLVELLISVYTHKDVYSKNSNDYQFIFMSRAFEIIVYSFLSLKNGAQVSDDLYKIMGRRPFYSIFNISPTKAIENDDDVDTDDPGKLTESSKELDIRRRVSSVLADKLKLWEKENIKLFDSINSAKLIPIFVYIFNKTFTAFNSFRVNRYFKEGKYSKEYLTDHIKRFEYMLINAAHTAMIEGTAVAASVAVTDNQETIRNPEIFRQSDNTLSRNKALLNEENPSDNTCEILFIKALESHPLFKLIQFETPLNKEGCLHQKLKLNTNTSSSRRLDPILKVEEIRGSSIITSILPKEAVASVAKYILASSDFESLAKCPSNIPKIRSLLRKQSRTRMRRLQSIVSVNGVNIDELTRKDGDFVNNLLLVVGELLRKGQHD